MQIEPCSFLNLNTCTRPLPFHFFPSSCILHRIPPPGPISSHAYPPQQIYPETSKLPRPNTRVRTRRPGARLLSVLVSLGRPVAPLSPALDRPSDYFTFVTPCVLQRRLALPSSVACHPQHSSPSPPARNRWASLRRSRARTRQPSRSQTTSIPLCSTPRSLSPSPPCTPSLSRCSTATMPPTARGPGPSARPSRSASSS